MDDEAASVDSLALGVASGPDNVIDHNINGYDDVTTMLHGCDGVIKPCRVVIYKESVILTQL